MNNQIEEEHIFLSELDYETLWKIKIAKWLSIPITLFGIFNLFIGYFGHGNFFTIFGVLFTVFGSILLVCYIVIKSLITDDTKSIEIEPKYGIFAQQKNQEVKGN